MSIALTFVVAAALSAGCVWSIARWTGAVIPVVDILIITGLCSGLALLPAYGWLLATVIMSLVITRATKAEPWPDAVLMVVGSNVVWLLAKVTLLGWI